jgi:glycerol-3-phosphate O-acyltransferase
MEVVPFVLGHFCTGPDARRLNELLETSQQQAGTPQAMMRLGTDRQYTIIHVIPVSVLTGRTPFFMLYR